MKFVLRPLPCGLGRTGRAVRRLVFVLVLLVLVTPGESKAADMFRTPDNAALCRVTYNDREWVWQTLMRSFMCVTPNDGFYLRMTNLYRNKPTITKGYRKMYKGMSVDATTPILRFGQDWDPLGVGVIACRSRRTGLTCHAGRGHGWWIGRFRGYRIF